MGCSYLKKNFTFTPTKSTNHKSKFPIDCVFWKSKLYPWFFVPSFFSVSVDSKSTHLLSEINLNKLPKKQKSYTKKGPLKNLREGTSAIDAPVVTILSPKKRSGIVFRFQKLAFFWPNENLFPFSLEISRLKRCTSGFSLQEEGVVYLEQEKVDQT